MSSPSTARFWPPQLPVFMFSGILQMRVPASLQRRLGAGQSHQPACSEPQGMQCNLSVDGPGRSCSPALRFTDRKVEAPKGNTTLTSYPAHQRGASVDSEPFAPPADAGGCLGEDRGRPRGFLMRLRNTGCFRRVSHYKVTLKNPPPPPKLSLGWKMT